MVPIFKGQGLLEGGTDRLSRNVVRNCHFTLRKLPEECRSRLQREGNLNTRKIFWLLNQAPDDRNSLRHGGTAPCILNVDNRYSCVVSFTLLSIYRLIYPAHVRNKSLITGREIFHISLTVRLGIILVNNQLDALFSVYLFISLLYMFRATQCSSSGKSNCINTSSGMY